MPIQILPAARRNPTFLESLGAGIGQGLDEGMDSFLEKRKLAQKESKENTALEKAGFGDMIGLPEKAQQAAITERLKGERKKSEFDDIMSQLKGKKSDSQNNVADQLTGSDSQYDPSNIDDDLITSITAINAPVGKDLRHAKDVAIRENTERDKMAQKENVERRKETLPLRKEYADKAKYARQGIENKKSQIALIKSGKINDPVTIALAKYLPGAVGNRLLSPQTQVYQSGLFEEFGVLKNMFPGQIRVKEIELLEDKLATLDKSDSAKEEILETGILKSERDIIMAKHARELEKENPNATYLEMEEEVAKRAEKDLDNLYTKLIDRYEDIYVRNAPAKTSWVDQHGKVYKNVSKDELKDFMSEAKQNGLEIRVKK